MLSFNTGESSHNAMGAHVGGDINTIALNEETGGGSSNIQVIDAFLNPNSSEHAIKAM